MDRPSGAYIQDPKTGEITPDLSDEAMKNRLAADRPEQLVEDQEETDQPDKRKRR